MNTKTFYSRFVIIVCILLSSQLTLSQANFWQPTNGPNGGIITDIKINNENDDIFLVSYSGYDNRIYRSSDNGQHWTRIVKTFEARCLAIDSSSNLYAVSGSNVYRSSDNGSNWVRCFSGLEGTDIRSIAFRSDGYLFAGTATGGIYISSDRGDHWTNIFTGTGTGIINCMTFNPSGHIYAGTELAGVFRSSDNGVHWVQRNTGLINLCIFTIALHTDGALYSGTIGGGGSVFKSTDNGDSWSLLNSSWGQYGVAQILCNSSGHIFAASGSGSGVWRSTDGGVTWTLPKTGFTNGYATCLEINSLEGIFTGTYGGVFYSEDGGGSWLEINNGIMNTNISSMTISHDGDIFAGNSMWASTVFRYSCETNSWNQSLFSPPVYALIAHPQENRLFAGGDETHISFDNGTSWTQAASLNRIVTMIVIPPETLFAGTRYDGLHRSTDNGNSWLAKDNGISSVFITALGMIDSQMHVTLFAGTADAGIFRSTNNGDTWTTINAGLTNLHICSIFSPDDSTILIGTESNSYKSTNKGTTWSQISSAPSNVWSFTKNDLGHLFAASFGNGIYRSTDYGITWRQISLGLENSYVTSIVSDNSGFLMTGTSGGGVFRSINSTTTSISGIKFNDSNRNGNKDAGEELLSGWRITASGPVSKTITTGADGRYLFLDLPAGTYTISEEHKSGWLQSLPGGGGSYSVTLADGDSADNISFGNYIPTGNAIYGSKYFDYDANGVKDVDEPGIPAWPMHLYNGSLHIDSTATDAAGNYAFKNLADGIYTVREQVNSTWIQTYPPSGEYTGLVIGGGSALTDIDFGNFLPSSISGMKFYDINRNGVKDTGEPGVPKWTIRLYRGVLLVDSAVTDANGMYLFNNLSEGTYKVREKLEPGWILIAPPGGEYAGITITHGTVVTGRNFANYQPNTIGGMKFNDLNGDSVKEDSEPGLAGWRIRLFRDTIQIDSVLTDINGSYTFSNLAVGTYAVREVLQSGWMVTTPVGGDYNNLVISEGLVFLGKNFGNFHMGNISGQTFYDLNGNGVKDAGEEGLSTWRIRLSGAKTDSALTDASGYYSLNNLPHGSYTVSEVQQSGWERTLPAAPGIYAINIATSGQNEISKDFGNHHPAPKVKLTLSVHGASGVPTRTLYWGVRLGASYGIFGVDPEATEVDSMEGEDEVPPPVSGYFDTRFVDPKGGTALFGGGSWTDMRDYRNEVQADTFKVTFRPGLAGYPVTLKWQKELVTASYKGAVHLIDATENIYDMKALDSLVVSDPSVTYLLLIARSPSPSYIYQKGWTLISVPYNVADGRKEILFPMANTSAYAFDPAQGYVVQNVLEPGIGYWLKFSSPVDLLNITGTPRTSDTIDVFPGWNLVGALGVSIDVASIVSDPANIIIGDFFSYSRGYQPAFTLEPLYGYWIKIGEVGKLYLSEGELRSMNRSLSSADRGKELEKMNSFMVADADGNEQRLYFANTRPLQESWNCELPPLPPAGIFDARFSSNMRIVVNEAGKEGKYPIIISSARHPVTISWEMKAAATPSFLRVGKNQIILKGKGTTAVYGSKDEITLLVAGRATVPQMYLLEQNYPNPFNPTTTINYGLPAASNVRLVIYNVLGQKAAVLVDGIQEPGYKDIKWNATTVASGIYFYRLDATSISDPAKHFSNVRKMMLIK
jgi:photosystem II stability/assembly factor-like uncharacterized protein